MKFGKQLELGLYAPWKVSYIQYARLKRVIQRKAYLAGKNYDIESPEADHPRDKDKKKNKIKAKGNDPEGEEMPLLGERGGYGALGSSNSNSSGSSTRHVPTFTPSIASSPAPGTDPFFDLLEEELAKIDKFAVGKLAELRVLLAALHGRKDDPNRTHHSDGYRDYLTEIKGIYMQLVALRKFCSLNATGFVKIVKKHDKVMGTTELPAWRERVAAQFFASTSEPQELMDDIAELVSRDKLLLWEADEMEMYVAHSDKHALFSSVRPVGLIVSLGVFVLVTLLTPLLGLGGAGDPSGAGAVAGRCLGMLLLVICLWITEAVPYFATALLIPVLVVLLRVMRKEEQEGVAEAGVVQLMDAEEAANFVFSHMFTHTTVLILGGYAISSAFSRCQLELRVASYFQSLLGSSPRLFMLAVMMLGLFLSMWISNHTAPILCAAIVMPIIHDFPSNSQYSKSLLLGLAFACNFGGLMTPISSLQNVIAVAQLQGAGIEVTFLHWMAVAVPFGVLGTLVSWAVILYMCSPIEVSSIPVVVLDAGAQGDISLKSWVVVGVSLLTCLMFAAFALFKDTLGDIAVVSLCYVVFMFGTGLLTEVDFNSMSWHTLMLLGGGTVLGKAVESSGLLAIISESVISALPLNHPWLALVCVLLFVGSVSTFVSHTVAALILLPIVTQVGVHMGMPEVVVVLSAFAVSGGMALPFSSFPNVNSLLVVDDFRKSYLTTADFLRTGLPMTVITIGLIATVGYALVEALVVKP